MSERGYIKLHRESLDHWLYGCKPYDKWHAWVDILLTANFKKSKKSFRGKPQVIYPGQLPTSIGYLAEKWGWSEGKVRRFLDELEMDGMLSQKRTFDGTTLTVENWGKWQIVRTTNSTPNGIPDSIPDSIPDGIHYKNVKKDKNDKNPLNPPKGGGGGGFPSESEDDEEERLRDIMRRIGRGEEVD